MRTKVNLLLVCLLACTIANAQDNFKLSLKALSLDPDYKVEQVHTLTLENTSESDLTIHFFVENTECEQLRTLEYSNLEHVLLDGNSSSVLNNTIVIDPLDTLEFSIKIIKPSNVKLGSMNCTKIIARTSGNNNSEQSIIIRSYIPNPTTDN